MSDHRREIDELRRQLTLIDAELLGALDRRAKASKAIGSLLDPGQPPPLSLHDRPQIEALVTRSTGDMPPESLRLIFRDVFAASFGLQAPLTVTYVGLEGGAALSIARGHFGSSANLVAYDSEIAALEEVTRQRAAFAVLPYETSADGPVPKTIAALTRSELRVSLVLEASPSLHLLNRTGNPRDIQKIYATAGDRALADKSLRVLGYLTVIEAASPQAACRFAADDVTASALATEGTGAQVGLEIAFKNILDRGTIAFATPSSAAGRRRGPAQTSPRSSSL
jgi:chorismate mutase/prephenate dehydratase